MNDYRFKFPDLYQFFGGYFYQGWTTDYRWEGTSPNFAAVVRHFKAVNPPAAVVMVRNQLEDLLALGTGEEELAAALNALGNNYYSPAGDVSYQEWLREVIEILRESPTKSRILRELS